MRGRLKKGPNKLRTGGETHKSLFFGAALTSTRHLRSATSHRKAPEPVGFFGCSARTRSLRSARRKTELNHSQIPCAQRMQAIACLWKLCLLGSPKGLIDICCPVLVAVPVYAAKLCQAIGRSTMFTRAVLLFSTVRQ